MAPLPPLSLLLQAFAFGEPGNVGVIGDYRRLGGEKPVGDGLRHLAEDDGAIPIAHVVLHILGRRDLLACCHHRSVFIAGEGARGGLGGAVGYVCTGDSIRTQCEIERRMYNKRLYKTGLAWGESMIGYLKIG